MPNPWYHEVLHAKNWPGSVEAEAHDSCAGLRDRALQDALLAGRRPHIPHGLGW
jgi:hypothetical protein